MNRRDFLTSAGAALAASSLPAFSAAPVPVAPGVFRDQIIELWGPWKLAPGTLVENCRIRFMSRDAVIDVDNALPAVRDGHTLITGCFLDGSNLSSPADAYRFEVEETV